MKIKSDEQIKSDVVAELKWDTRVDASDVKVSVEDSVATLSGTVGAYSAKTAAVNSTWNVRGVVSVIDDINVQFPSTFEIPSDEEIKTNALNSLLWDPVIDSSKISIKVKNGVLTLTGTVESYWKKRRAESDVNYLSGVISVKNQIAIVPTESWVDEDIAKDIVDAMKRKLDVSADDVSVHVRNGVATISGTVDDYVAWKAAFESAENTLGVVDVKDQIKIG